MCEYSILITNDDGIESPGLKAAVESVLNIGTITVVAPSQQQTGTGGGWTGNRNSTLIPTDYRVNDTEIRAYHCDCSPALIVRHRLRTIFKVKKPDLLISGINYGENLGTDIMSSGTIGAALEASNSGIKSIAISKQTEVESHHIYTDQDWSATSYFLAKISRILLEKKLQPDVDVLKIDVPIDANKQTKWNITKMAKTGYYFRAIKTPNVLTKLNDGKTIIRVDQEALDPESDIHALAIEHIVSVTPLSIDFTSRVNIAELQRLLEK